MRGFILGCIFMFFSGAAIAGWFTASGVEKAEWFALSKEERVATETAWRKKWNDLSRVQRKQRLKTVKDYKRRVINYLKKWEMVSFEQEKKESLRRAEEEAKIKQERKKWVEQFDTLGSAKSSKGNSFVHNRYDYP